MSRRTKQEAEKTRLRIMASALALFVRNGYERTTLTDIAARLKLTKGAVYWHFKSKEFLLMALVDEMLAKFRRNLAGLGVEAALSFPLVSNFMVEHARQLVNDPKGAAFFLLMQTQVRWSEDSMTKVREEFLSGRVSGPYHAFLRALENDRDAGRLRPGVDIVMAASAAMALWTGLVRSKIEKFLACDLATVLRRTYDSMWCSIKQEEKR